jgi:hypothetical protein
VASGWAVLDWMNGLGLKGDSHIFAYSHLTNVNEVQRVYSLGANSFLKRLCEKIHFISAHFHFDDFLNAEKAIHRYGAYPVYFLIEGGRADIHGPRLYFDEARRNYVCSFYVGLPDSSPRLSGV